MNNLILSNKLLDAYPFLREVPTRIFREIDQNEIYLPTKNELVKLTELGAALQNYIILYKPGYSAGESCLCRVLRPAELTDSDIRTLITFEAEHKPESIAVAYKKPLTLKSF